MSDQESNERETLMKEEGEQEDEEDQSAGDPSQSNPAEEVNECDSSGAPLGGASEEPCFALLDGVFEDPETNTKTRVTIPITRLPAILGRSHETDDPHFFGLGKKKSLSRKQCLIEYRAGKNGRVEWDDDKQKLVYKDKPEQETGEIGATGNEDGNDLPKTGYFAIGSMGKNRIMVNKERIAQGKVALLESGTPIRISSYMLYFLLPTDAPPQTHSLPDKLSSKKRKAVPDGALSSSDNKKAKANMGATFQAELDAMTVENLLSRMTHAINNNEWERRHQLIGSTIALHAVRAAAMDPAIQATALKLGVSRSAIMSWIDHSDKYQGWVEQMLTKMEPRSYQAAVTKSLLKAGFTRTGSSGRYIKWLLPKDIPIVVKQGAKHGNQDKDNLGANEEDEERGDDAGKENEEEEEEDDGEENEADSGDGGENGDDKDGDENDSGPPASGGSDDEEEGSDSELEKTGGDAATAGGDCNE